MAETCTVFYRYISEPLSEPAALTKLGWQLCMYPTGEHPHKTHFKRVKDRDYWNDLKKKQTIIS